MSDRLYRSLIRIEAENDGIYDVIIPGWDPYTTVNIPTHIVPLALREGACRRGYLICWVNIGAEDIEDLVFERFEAAPDINPNDGLA